MHFKEIKSPASCTSDIFYIPALVFDAESQNISLIFINRFLILNELSFTWKFFIYSRCCTQHNIPSYVYQHDNSFEK